LNNRKEFVDSFRNQVFAKSKGEYIVLNMAYGKRATAHANTEYKERLLAYHSISNKASKYNTTQFSISILLF